MISFNYENNFNLTNEIKLSKWLSSVILTENCIEGEINYIFCDDEYLHKINVEFLNHDTFTVLIRFDYSTRNTLQGDIYIYTERVVDKANEYNVQFYEALQRDVVQGILH